MRKKQQKKQIQLMNEERVERERERESVIPSEPQTGWIIWFRLLYVKLLVQNTAEQYGFLQAKAHKQAFWSGVLLFWPKYSQARQSFFALPVPVYRAITVFAVVVLLSHSAICPHAPSLPACLSLPPAMIHGISALSASSSMFLLRI